MAQLRVSVGAERTAPAENKEGPKPQRASQDFCKPDSSHRLWLPLMNSFNSRLGKRPRNLKFYNDWRSFGSSSRELYDAKIELVHCIPEVCGRDTQILILNAAESLLAQLLSFLKGDEAGPAF